MENSAENKEVLPSRNFGSGDQRNSDSSMYESVISVRRVNKVIAGGRRMAFSACVVVGDYSGNVGVAFGKGREASLAISKATRRAKKNMIPVVMKGSSIPHKIETKLGASKLFIGPACAGTGIKAGGAVRQVVTAAGIRDILAKSFGSANPINQAMVALKALKMLKSPAKVAYLRDVKFAGKDFVEAGEEKNV